jgi:transcription elongation GreA/GreB family factor
MTMPDKNEVLLALDAELAAQIEAAAGRARASAESAVHEEGRAEDEHDTRAIEESYLARGQAQRVADLELDRAALRSLVPLDFKAGRPIASSALVELEDEDGRRIVVLLAPAAGGLSVSVGGTTVRVVTPKAPLAQALLGKVLDDDVEVGVGDSSREYVVVGVR